jgi:hypothetical protein
MLKQADGIDDTMNFCCHNEVHNRRKDVGLAIFIACAGGFSVLAPRHFRGDFKRTLSDDLVLRKGTVCWTKYNFEKY